MTQLATCVAGILLTVGLAGVSAQSSTTVTVRLYNLAGVSADDIARAQLAAEPILRNAGLDVIMRRCGGLATPGAPLDDCSDRITPTDVIVRIIDAPKYHLALGPQVFGVAYVVKGSRGGRLATLYSDRIISAAARVDVEKGTLLGRVLAHEVGHLLLGTNHHGDTGLMRGDWTDSLLNDTREKEWHFSPAEAMAMQHHLLAQSIHSSK
jgi:hypothetical protein